MGLTEERCVCSTQEPSGNFSLGPPDANSRPSGRKRPLPMMPELGAEGNVRDSPMLEPLSLGQTWSGPYPSGPAVLTFPPWYPLGLFIGARFPPWCSLHGGQPSSQGISCHCAQSLGIASCRVSPCELGPFQVPGGAWEPQELREVGVDTQNPSVA